jgi:acetyl-CoA carboxylase biotin carboxyl carrier protein
MPVPLSNEDVRDILSLLDTLPFDEFTLETSRFTLHLRRGAGGGWTQETQVLAPPVAAAPGRPGAAADAPSGGAPGAVVPRAEGGPRDGEGRPGRDGRAGDDGQVHEVRAPLPGTFYRAPQPGAPPYVDTGGQVEPDTVVALIETMKLMNPVYAGTTGTVGEICLDDGEFADQDAVLMRIRGQAG